MKAREVDWKTYYEKLWKPRTMTTPTEGMTLAQFTAARAALKGALAQFEKVRANCKSCTHFEMGRCTKFEQDVPADFQQQDESCGSWQFDAIPF